MESQAFRFGAYITAIYSLKIYLYVSEMPQQATLPSITQGRLAMLRNAIFLVNAKWFNRENSSYPNVVFFIAERVDCLG